MYSWRFVKYSTIALLTMLPDRIWIMENVMVLDLFDVQFSEGISFPTRYLCDSPPAFKERKESDMLTCGLTSA